MASTCTKAWLSVIFSFLLGEDATWLDERISLVHRLAQDQLNNMPTACQQR
jgi:hypothetical protein